MEVAELAQVSAGWYEQFESGTSRRSFSHAFVQRVASALRLTDQERATLFRLVFADVARAAPMPEANVRDGAARYVAQVRDFVLRMAAATSFEEVARTAVEAAQTLLGPTCATVASIENGHAPPRTFAAGPRAGFVGPALAQCMLEMNDAVRNGCVVLCDDSPHPDAITNAAAHPVRIRASDGTETHGVHDVSMAAYQGYNRHLVQRSELVAGLFENGTCRGVISCSWTEPRTHRAIEIAMIEMLVTIVALVSASPLTG